MPRPKAGDPSKSDFVRQNLNVPAAELVEKAKAAGIKLTPSLVYKARSRTGGRKTAARRGRRGGKRSGNASDFVRSMPRDMPAKQVIAAAARKGIKMSANLVYMVRSKARTQGPGGGARGRRGRRRRGQGGAADTVAFKRMALGMGLARARQELDELERGLAQLIGS